MQGIYNYIPETNHVARICSVASVMWLHFMLRVMLFRMLNMLCTFTLALSEVCPQCPLGLFSVFRRVRTFPECCSCIFRMGLKWFQLLVLLLA